MCVVCKSVFGGTVSRYEGIGLRWDVEDGSKEQEDERGEGGLSRRMTGRSLSRNSASEQDAAWVLSLFAWAWYHLSPMRS
jgi:hypothetical protein